MGIMDAFKGNEYRSKISELEKQVIDLQSENARLQSMMTPQMQNIENLRKKRMEICHEITDLQAQHTELENTYTEKERNLINQFTNKESEYINKKASFEGELSSLQTQIDNKKKCLVQMDEEILLQEFGVYKPKYSFATSEQYKARLLKIRQDQKELIKNDRATTGNMNWTVNNNAVQGKKMVKDMQKLLLRAFNCECDEVIDKVKFNSFDSSAKRITSSYEAISKLGQIMQVSITKQYYDSKIDELTLALEYAAKKQEEKELQKELRAQEKEAAKLQREIAEERKKKEKEQIHYENALHMVEKQLLTATPEQRSELIEKRNNIQSQLDDIDRSIKDIDYREANQKAGYVYVISNIGSFGENVYKIGMTRRLDPMDRVVELGDASVPFNFDVHAMIFSDDAPKLEAALHKAFEDKKVNMVNQRREFFNVTLNEIKDVVRKNFDKTVEFNDFADAEQYRISLKMKQQ